MLADGGCLRAQTRWRGVGFFGTYSQERVIRVRFVAYKVEWCWARHSLKAGIPQTAVCRRSGTTPFPVLRTYLGAFCTHGSVPRGFCSEIPFSKHFKILPKSFDFRLKCHDINSDSLRCATRGGSFMDQFLDYHGNDSIQEMSLSSPHRNEAQTRSVTCSRSYRN